MKRGPLVAALSFSLIVGATLSPTGACAGGGHAARASGMAGGGSPPGFQNRGFQIQGGSQHHGFTPHPGFHHHNFKGHPGFRPFFSSGVATTWAPPVYSYGPEYYSTPAYYVPVPVLPAPPPAPSVVQYPHGRYELRGDGWVWVPAPPAPPPPPAPATSPPPPPAAVEPPQQRPPSATASVTPAHQVKLYLGAGKPPQSVQLYRWTDEQGVVQWADRPDAVPPRYRNQAKGAPPP